MEKFKCDVCNIEVPTQLVLNEHLSGSKHAKKLRALDIIKGNVKNSFHGSTYTSDMYWLLNTYVCEICNVTVNSRHQLDIHYEGSSHRQKALAQDTFDETASVTSDNGKQSESEEITEVSNPTVGYPGARYHCAACNLWLNSDYQRKEHEASKKHIGKLTNKNSDSGSVRAAPYSKKKGVAVVSGVTAFKCHICNVYVNSEVQLKMHGESKKHNDKYSKMVGGNPGHTDSSKPLLPTPNTRSGSSHQYPQWVLKRYPFLAETATSERDTAEMLRPDPYQPHPLQSDPYQPHPFQPDLNRPGPHRAEGLQYEPYRPDPHRAEGLQYEPYRPDPFRAEGLQYDVYRDDPYQALGLRRGSNQAHALQPEPNRANPYQAGGFSAGGGFSRY